MNTKIKFTFKDVSYTLEYDRNSIKMLEKAGFDIKSAESQMYTSIDLAFRYAFVKNHRNASNELIDEIYQNISDKDKLIEKLFTMIGETYNTLLGDDSDKGNIKWDIANS